MKVLLVEDSPTIVRYVQGVLRRHPEFILLPAAKDGIAGVEASAQLKPDVILMDLELPRLDGVSAIKTIMHQQPRPIVVLSAHLQAKDQDRTFAAFGAGAVEVLAKPAGLDAKEVGLFEGRLVRTLRMAAQAQLVRRWKPVAVRPLERAWSNRIPHIVAIGSSTGGPPVLFGVLQTLPPAAPWPIVIAQHIMPGFEPGLVRWLGSTGHDVRLAEEGMQLAPGTVYVAPAHCNTTVTRNLTLTLAKPSPGHPTPSVDALFDSCRELAGDRSAAILLSGMGTDGAAGLRRLRDAGALTVTQSGSSCVVDGMPGSARELGAQVHDLSPDEIAALLRGLAMAGEAPV